MLLGCLTKHCHRALFTAVVYILLIVESSLTNIKCVSPYVHCSVTFADVAAETVFCIQELSGMSAYNVAISIVAKGPRIGKVTLFRYIFPRRNYRFKYEENTMVHN